MEQENTNVMMELMSHPAFSVKDGIIQYANSAAVSCLIPVNAPVAAFIGTGAEEYGSEWNGCLYLSVTVEGHCFGASVTRMDGFDLFILDENSSQPQLQAMALAARELRAPLSTLLITAGRLTPVTGQEECAARMNKSLYQLLRLVNNMSDAARYTVETAPRMDLQDVTAIVREVFEKAAALTSNTGVTLNFSCCDESVISLADPEKLERAIYNILSNAIKFTPQGGTVDASLTHSGSKLRLTVTDSGSGISDEILGSLFTRHLRQPSLEDSRQGIGLGMVLIRAAAAAHGGTVLVQHCGNTGTKITLTLAVRKDLNGNLGSPRLKVDYAGEYDHALTELADVLPHASYEK